MYAARDKHSSMDSDQQDDALLSRIAQHDAQAFEVFYLRYQPRLRGYLRSLLKSPDLIEDAFQEALLVVWQQADRYRASGRVSTWLFGIARRKALKASAQAPRSWPALPVEPEAPGQHNPEHRMTRQETAHVLQQALITLPPSVREAFTLMQEQGYSAQMIAAHQDCAVATVHYRLRQARRSRASKLEVAPLRAAKSAPHRPAASARPLREYRSDNSPGSSSAKCPSPGDRWW